jgi:DNA-binding winged helix-turn-helix (wHTH) protein
VIGDLQVDTAARTVPRGDRTIDLPPREYALLEYLALRKGQVVSRTEIEQHIYDEHVEPASNVVDAAVYALRRKIDPADGPSFIRTRRGMGYTLLAVCIMKSIQRALIFKLGFWALSLALLTGIGFYFYMRSALLAQFDQSLAAKARTVATQLKREGDGRLEFEFSKKAMPEFQRDSPGIFSDLAERRHALAASKSLEG